MSWVDILWLITAGANVVLLVWEGRLLRKTRKLNGDVGDLLNFLKGMPEVVPCYECKYYEEGAPFCPKSAMRMKDGLIFCCYGDRKESSDEGEN